MKTLTRALIMLCPSKLPGPQLVLLSSESAPEQGFLLEEKDEAPEDLPETRVLIPWVGGQRRMGTCVSNQLAGVAEAAGPQGHTSEGSAQCSVMMLVCWLGTLA